MARMKTFLLYLILFVSFFIFSSVISNWAVKGLNEKITDIEILTKTPIIAVDNCETGKYSGNISGTVRNDTGKHIEKAFLKIDLYNQSNRYIGTKYEELRYFNVNELLKFSTKFRFEDVEAIKLSVVYDERQVEQISNQNSNWSFGNIMLNF